jgi:Raf kinase inhibitor-like YbhB/YbcL family protein
MAKKICIFIFFGFLLSACNTAVDTPTPTVMPLNYLEVNLTQVVIPTEDAIMDATISVTLAPTGGKDFWISTSNFKNGESIPAVYTCQNSNQIGKPPTFSWGSLPTGTKSLALIAEDPDAPLGVFTHWVVYNIPPEVDTLPEGMPVKVRIVGIATQGVNSFGQTGYGGPCPPFGQTHRYYFRLYALDTGTSLEEGLDSARLREKINGHILGQTEWMGVYKQP